MSKRPQPPNEPPWPRSPEQKPRKQPEQSSSGEVTAAFFGAIGISICCTVAVTFTISAADSSDGDWPGGILAALLALGSLGGGGATAYWAKNTKTQTFGITLMAMWGLLSLTTLGLCTGINPLAYD